MTDPYASIAEVYDIMIDWPARLARERAFFASLFSERPIQRVLDVGCGTGHHTRFFAELGADAIGLDPSAPMLARARTLTVGENPRFVDGGFADLPALPGAFDLIAVLGNTLAYVRSAAELGDVLHVMREKLTPGGRVVVQVVNYDRILAEGAVRLPLVHRQTGDREYLFLREYRREGRAVDFTLVTLTRADGWTQSQERSRHYPLTATRLHTAFRHAGFRDIFFYSAFQSSRYDPRTSGGLLVLAE